MDFDIVQTLYMLPGIIIGLTFHEFAHAQTAVWLGDDTPRLQGRTSLNPLVHIDIIGFLMLVIAHFGWAKPVQVDTSNFKNRKRDDILVSLAGPVMNLLLAVCFVILIWAISYIPESILDSNTLNILQSIFINAVWMNVVLFVFNLLPIPPLDGSHVVFGLLGLKDSSLYSQIYQMSTFILLILIITNVINIVIGPPIEYVYKFLISPLL
ncbi:site-2 protease family protein [Dehalobacter sp. TBBPA1]|uniref:site-2 protease family protein n=1 Tax=Dehalobacter sp. TBBPA1 TaxID=3235037 RepID=UPI0034A56C92